LPIENKAIKEIYPPLIHWDDILKSTVEVGKQNVLEHGGALIGGVLCIPHHHPTAAALEQTSGEEPVR